jgi:hypothetical protein
MTLDDIASQYENTGDAIAALHGRLTATTWSVPYLAEHRRFVETNALGYGDAAFHAVWDAVVASMPPAFSFLEIGVFKGQTVSLIALLARQHQRDAWVHGITPLSQAGDKYLSEHPADDYDRTIRRLHQWFDLDFDAFNIIHGFSNKDGTKRAAWSVGPFDVVYVDGCHDYDVVVSDLKTYGRMVKTGGLLVVDDCANALNVPESLYAGLPDVSRAVADIIEPDPRFQHLAAVGHLRLWKRV